MTDLSVVSCRPIRITFEAPLRAYVDAMARPMPREAPVMTVVLPLSRGVAGRVGVWWKVRLVDRMGMGRVGGMLRRRRWDIVRALGGMGSLSDVVALEALAPASPVASAYR